MWQIISYGTVSDLATLYDIPGTDCDGQHEEDKCGRPLGLTFTQTGKLLGNLFC